MFVCHHPFHSQIQHFHLLAFQTQLFKLNIYLYQIKIMKDLDSSYNSTITTKGSFMSSHKTKIY